MKIFTATAVAMAVAVPVASANTNINANFSDVTATNAHFNAIQSLAERGVINGYEDGTYRPNVVLTRAQAAKILAEVLNLDTTDTKTKFKDVATTSSYAGAINALAKEEIISGYEDGTFKPNAPLTRGQMAKIIVNAFKLEQSTTLTHSFKDVSETNGYKYFIQTLVDHNITQGTTPTTFAPSEPIKRGQMASFVVRSEQASKKDVAEVELGIEAVRGKNVITTEGTFELDSSLANILSESNNESLKGALMKVSVEQGRITDIHKLTIRASGIQEKPVVFDGQNDTFNGLISVAGDAVEIKNIKLTQDLQLGGLEQTFVKLNAIEVTGKLIVVENEGKVASLYPVANSERKVTYQIENSKIAATVVGRNNITIDANADSVVGHITFSNNVKNVTLNGRFEKVTLQSANAIQLLGTATITQLVVTDSTAKIHLPTTMKIKNIVLPADVNIASIIENYNEVRGNIESVNGGANSGTTSNVTGNYDSSGGSNTWTPSPTPKPEEPKPEEPKPTPPSIGGQPLDPGTEQLPGKPQPPLGQVITSTIVDITVTTGDSSSVTTGDTSSVATSDEVQVKLADGQTYFVESKLGSFMKYNKGVLGGAEISVILNNGQIVAIKDLELKETNATLIDGGKITIYGTLKVSKNIEKIMNINVTENVVLAANMAKDVSFIGATVFGKVEFEKATAFAKRSLLASITQVAAATTRIKITFADSTVAIIEVTKNDVDVYAGGTTEISNIRLFADNAEITSNLTNDKILPKIVVGQGVTQVTLNSSIANVIIETDENIIVEGRGHFDEVIVNTSKEVAINTIGTIGNLNIKDDKPNISLGKEIEEVKQVTTVLPITEVLQNYEEMKGKIGQVVLPEADFFAAELIEAEESFGYYTIKLASIKNFKVKYQLLDSAEHWETYNKIVRNETKVPTQAIDYKVGEQIAIPANKFLVVYLVDSFGVIKDFENDFRYGTNIRFTSTSNGVKIETTYDVKDGSSVADVYNGFFNFSVGKPIVYLGTKTIGNYTWKKEGNLGVTYVPSSDIFTVDPTEAKSLYYIFEGNQRKINGNGYTGRLSGGAKLTTFKAIKKLYEVSANDPAPKGLASTAINSAFYVYLNQKEHVVPYDSDTEQYRSAVEKATTLEELYDLIVQVNNSEK